MARSPSRTRSSVSARLSTSPSADRLQTPGEAREDLERRRHRVVLFLGLHNIHYRALRDSVSCGVSSAASHPYETRISLICVVCLIHVRLAADADEGLIVASHSYETGNLIDLR